MEKPTQKITVTIEGRETIIWFIGQLLLRHNDQNEEMEKAKARMPSGVSWLANAYYQGHWAQMAETKKALEQALEMFGADPHWCDQIAHQLKTALNANRETNKAKP